MPKILFYYFAEYSLHGHFQQKQNILIIKSIHSNLELLWRLLLYVIKSIKTEKRTFTVLLMFLNQMKINKKSKRMFKIPTCVIWN